MADLFHFTPLLQSLGWALLHSLWQLGLLAIGVHLLNRQTSGRQADLRFGLAFGALLAGLLAFVVTFLLYWQGGLSESFAMGEQIWMPIKDEAAVATTGSSPTAMAEGLAYLRQLLTDATPYICLFWVTGLSLYSLRYLTAWWYLRRLRRIELSPVSADWIERFGAMVRLSACRRTVGLYYSNLIQAPLTLGWWRPVVLLPAGFFLQLSPVQAEAVLWHELAHIRRHDYLLNLIQLTIKGIFFYHPGVHFLTRCIHVEREHACDDLVIQQTGDPKSLAKALGFLKLNAFHHQNAFAMYALKQDQFFLRRLKRLFDPETSGQVPASGRMLLLVLLLLGGLLTAFYSMPDGQLLDSEAQQASSIAAVTLSPTPLHLDRLPPILDTLPDESPKPEPEPTPYPEPVIEPDPVPVPEPLISPVPQVDPVTGIVGPYPEPVPEPLIGTQSTGASVIGLSAGSSEGVVIGGGATVVDADSRSAGLFPSVAGRRHPVIASGSVIVGDNPVGLQSEGRALIVSGEARPSLFSGGSGIRALESNPVSFDGNMGQLKRTLLRHLTRDGLIANRSVKTVIEYPGERITVNGQVLEAALFDKYVELLQSFDIDPDPQRQIRISPKYIMVGVVDEDGFRGRMQGTVDLSTDIH